VGVRKDGLTDGSNRVGVRVVQTRHNVMGRGISGPLVTMVNRFQRLLSRVHDSGVRKTGDTGWQDTREHFDPYRPVVDHFYEEDADGV